MQTKRVAAADTEFFNQIERELYSAVLADCLDELGHHECAMSERLRPTSSFERMVGWAKTISARDVHYELPNPYDKEIEAVDSILPGEVIVVSTGNSRRNAPWGELLSTAARSRGARGAIIDGLVRDVRKIEALGFPVFATGTKPVDSKGRGVVVEYDVPVDCGGALVRPGDLIFADYDGVVVVPASIVDEVVRRATEKATRENQTRDELKEGAYLRDVYNKYGVL
jgi:4-hydroxy-4-methyl-2-oxoglutarate aldolase